LVLQISAQTAFQFCLTFLVFKAVWRRRYFIRFIVSHWLFLLRRHRCLMMFIFPLKKWCNDLSIAILAQQISARTTFQFCRNLLCLELFCIVALFFRSIVSQLSFLLQRHWTLIVFYSFYFFNVCNELSIAILVHRIAAQTTFQCCL